MSTVYTIRQAQFIHAFMHHLRPLLVAFLKIDSVENSETIVSDKLDGVSKSINTACAAIAIAGTVGAPSTMGTSLAGASACIVLLQTLNGGYQFVKRHIHNKDEPFSPDETKLDEIHLSLSILLRQVAYLATVRYRHFIDEILEEGSVNTFASFVAKRAMKHLEKELAQKGSLADTLNAEAFLDYFMASARLSLSHKSTQVAVKDEYDVSQYSLDAIYAKLACSRAGLAVFGEPTPGQYMLYVSEPNNLFSTNVTTLQHHYGYATVPQSELRSETAAVNRKHLMKLSSVVLQETLEKNKQHFAIYYQVSRQEVSDYLIQARLAFAKNHPIKSLNQYLSESLDTNVIAACNDNRLRGLDLSMGNFCEVWMIGKADFSDCNLRNTVWTKAHLNGARFEKNDLTGSNFQHAYLENSMWQQVNFSGDFSHAKLNGSKLIDCTITATFNQFGCEWELVTMENIKQEDALQLLNLRFEEQRARECEEIDHINDKITALNRQYEICLNQAIENHDLSIKDKHDLVALHKKVIDLELQQATHMTQLEQKMTELKTQTLRIQNEQRKRLNIQEKIINQIFNRLNILESGTSNFQPSFLKGLSLFKSSSSKKNSDSKSPDTSPSNKHECDINNVERS